MEVLCVGHAAFDVTMRVNHQPAADEKMRADAINLAGGGPAANASVAIARLGGGAAFCGYLGTDQFGKLHLRELDSEGVDTSLVVRGVFPTPLSVILVKRDGKRSVVNYKGDTPLLAADAVSLESVRPAAMLFDGHEPLISAALLDRAKACDIPAILDAGSAHKGVLDLCMKVDYLAASATFARQYCHTDNMDHALRYLAERRHCVIITLGEGGLIWAKDGTSGVVPAFSVSVVDTTGAGDAFHGALALGIARGMDWTALLNMAAATAALTCTGLGVRASLPAMRDVRDLCVKGSAN